MRERLTFLDVAKGIGILLVLMGHGTGFLFGGAYITAFYMAMFFVVAGYVYKPGKVSCKDAVKKRFVRILVPYFAYNGLLFCYYLAKEIAGGSLDIRELCIAVGGVFYSRNALWAAGEDNIYFFRMANDPVWFLTAMCSAAAIFYPVVDKCLENWRKCAWIMAGLLVLAMALSYLPILLPWSVDSAPLFAFYMVAGAVLGQKKFFQKEHSAGKRIGMCVLIAASVGLRIWNGSTNLSVRAYGDYGGLSVYIVAFIGVAGSVLLLSICRMLHAVAPLERVLAKVGQSSLEIMALHMAVFQVLDRIVGKMLPQIPLSAADMERNVVLYWGYGAVKIAAAVVVSMGIGKTVPYFTKKVRKG